MTIALIALALSVTGIALLGSYALVKLASKMLRILGAMLPVALLAIALSAIAPMLSPITLVVLAVIIIRSK